MARIVGLHERKLFRIRDEFGAFQCRIDFAVCTKVDEFEKKNSPEFKVGTLNPKTF